MGLSIVKLKKREPVNFQSKPKRKRYVLPGVAYRALRMVLRSNAVYRNLRTVPSAMTSSVADALVADAKPDPKMMTS